jgi:hypothetical protein
LEIATSSRITKPSVSWISISSTVTVVLASLSDNTFSGTWIASSNVSSSARAGDWSVDTSSSAEIARVDCARVAIIAIFRTVVASSSSASGDCAQIRRNAQRSVLTAGRWIEGVDGTSITIIAARNNNLALVRRWVASIMSASRIAASDCVMNTSSCRIAMSCGTSWTISASDSSGGNSESCITSIIDTLIWWFCCNQLSRDISENTVSSASIARIGCANVLIVTDFRNM